MLENHKQKVPFLKFKLIQVDIGGHPPIPLGAPPLSLSVFSQLTIFSSFSGPELSEPF